MKKLLFLLGCISIAFAGSHLEADSNEQKEPFTYIEVGTFTDFTKEGGLVISYGQRTFYTSNIACDSALLTAFCFNADFVVAYKYVALFYLRPIKSVVTPYIGIGGFGGMVSYKDKYSKDRATTVCGNALGVLGCELDLWGQRQLISATYHLDSNAILLSIGRIF